MATIYCMNCGAELPEGSRFCPSCDSPTLLGAGLADVEGKPQAVCPSCKLYNDARAEHCARCGTPLGEAERWQELSLLERMASSPARKIAAVGAVGVLLAAALTAVLVSVGRGGSGGGQAASEQPAESAPTGESQQVTDKGATPESVGIDMPDVHDALGDYTWGELAQIAKDIEACASREDALNVAREYNLVGSDFKMRDDTKDAEIADMGTCAMRLVDVYHDDRADGAGKAGLTFIATNLPFTHPMNAEDTDEGGWEASDLRAWLNSEVYDAVDVELKNALVKVKKMTNNVGDATDVSCVSGTDDYLWVPSTVEIIGEVGWSYSADAANSDGYNAIANAEGEQYAAFHEEDVVEAGANETLVFQGPEGPNKWWTRSCSPTTELTYFRGVNETGDLVNLFIPVRENGVALGFCL